MSKQTHLSFCVNALWNIVDPLKGVIDMLSSCLYHYPLSESFILLLIFCSQCRVCITLSISNNFISWSFVLMHGLFLMINLSILLVLALFSFLTYLYIQWFGHRRDLMVAWCSVFILLIFDLSKMLELEL